jgi:hypothetical protein
MAAPTNTLTTLTPNTGVREDLENDVYRVAPEDCPFQNAIGKTKATAVFHEWQTRALATPNAANANFEGNNYTAAAPNTTSRVGNYTQIFGKAGSVAGTQEAVTTAGRDDELDTQKLLRGIEVKTDVEAAMLANRASAQEVAATSARTTAGVLAWATSNTSRGTGGSNGGFSGGVVAAATNGTQRTLTEAMYKSVLSSAFSKGARFKIAMMGATQKQQMSAFTGIADIRVSANPDKMAGIVAGAEVYASDFGNQVWTPHMFGLTRDVVLFDPEYLKVATLRPMATKMLGATGDADQFLITKECALVVANEKAIGVIADLQ